MHSFLASMKIWRWKKMKILVNDGGISTRNPQTINNGFATNLLNTNIVHLKGNQLQLHTQIIYTSLLTLYIYF
jgi:hypothetical protein